MIDNKLINILNYYKFYFVDVNINGYSFLFSTSLTIYQSLLQKGWYIPRFCFHVKLLVSGNCRMCFVELENVSKPIIACATNISNGLNVFTNSLLVFKCRESILEFILINHPIDCPVCDQGSECDLQDQYIVMGSSNSRYYENFKKSSKNKNITFSIKLSLNKCINCSRCVRFTQQVLGNYVFSLMGRGENSAISKYTDKFQKFEYSEIDLNLIELCPVGAISKKSFKKNNFNFLKKRLIWTTSKERALDKKKSEERMLNYNWAMYYDIEDIKTLGYGIERYTEVLKIIQKRPEKPKLIWHKKRSFKWFVISALYLVGYRVNYYSDRYDMYIQKLIDKYQEEEKILRKEWHDEKVTKVKKVKKEKEVYKLFKFISKVSYKLHLYRDQMMEIHGNLPDELLDEVWIESGKVLDENWRQDAENERKKEEEEERKLQEEDLKLYTEDIQAWIKKYQEIENKLAEENNKLEAEAQNIEEQRQKEEEKQNIEAEARKTVIDDNKVELENLRKKWKEAEEQFKRKEEERKLQEEENKRKAEEERKLQEEENKRKAEEERKLQEKENKKKAEARRIAIAAKDLEAENLRKMWKELEEERKKKAEEERLREEDLKLHTEDRQAWIKKYQENDRKMEAEKKKKLQEEKKKLQEEKKLRGKKLAKQAKIAAKKLQEEENKKKDLKDKPDDKISEKKDLKDKPDDKISEKKDLKDKPDDKKPLGALSSKFNSYDIRIWELTDVKFVDLFDIIQPYIRIDFRGLKIQRVLPIVSSDTKEEWISNEVRHFFKSIFKCRFYLPYLKKKNFIKFSWYNFFNLLKNVYYKLFFFFFDKKLYFIKNVNLSKNNLDVYNYNFYSFFFKKLNFLNVSYNVYKKLNLKREIYFIKNKNLDFLKAEHVYICFLNFRFNYPLFNYKLREKMVFDYIEIFVLGSFLNLNFYFSFIGNSFYDFLVFFKNFKMKKNYLFFYNEKNHFLANILSDKNTYYVKNILKNNKNIIFKETGYPVSLNINNFFKNFSLNFNNEFFSKNVNKTKKFFSLFFNPSLTGFKTSNIFIPRKLNFEQNSIFINVFGVFNDFTYLVYKADHKFLKSDSNVLGSLFKKFDFNEELKLSYIKSKFISNKWLYLFYNFTIFNFYDITNVSNLKLKSIYKNFYIINFFPFSNTNNFSEFLYVNNIVWLF